MSVRWLALLSVVAAGCGDATVTDFRVVSGANDPLVGATELVLALEQGDAAIAEERFSPTLSSLRLRGLPFGDGFRLRLDVLAGPFLLARGRSLPFAVRGSGPSRPPDLWVAPIGLFEEVTPPLDAAPAGLAPIEDGALIATEAGTLYRYVHHRSQDGRPELMRLGNLPSIAGAEFAPHGRRLVAVGGAESVARLVSPDGSVGPSTELAGQAHGAVVVSIGERVVVLGGSDRAFGAAGTQARVLRIVAGGELMLEREDALPCPVRDARAGPVQVSSPASGVRVVTFCRGSPSGTDLLAYDPDSGSSFRLALAGDRTQAGLVSLGNGLALVSGGRDAEGRVSAETFVVGVGGARLEQLMPGPGMLFRPREGHACLMLRPGLALVVGGTDARGAVGVSELVSFPGDVVLTGSMEPPAARPLATILDDGAVAVVGSGGVHLWIVPR